MSTENPLNALRERFSGITYNPLNNHYSIGKQMPLFGETPWGLYYGDNYIEVLPQKYKSIVQIDIGDISNRSNLFFLISFKEEIPYIFIDDPRALYRIGDEAFEDIQLKINSTARDPINGCPYEYSFIIVAKKEAFVYHGILIL